MYKSLNAGLVGAKPGGFEATLAIAKKYGYGAMAYSPESLVAEGIDVYQAQDLMGQYGMILSDFGLPLQITSRENYNEGFSKLEKAAQMAAKLGIHRCVTWMASSSNEMDFAENFAYHTKMFRTIAGVLKEYDILFGVEFLGPKAAWTRGKYPFVHTIDKMLELCDAVGTGNMGLMLDAHHCYCSGLRGADFAEFIRSEKDIVLVHLNDDAAGVPLDEVKDSPRYYPGEPGGGANDLLGFMQALQDMGYTGPVAAEPNSATLKSMVGDDDGIIKIVSESTDSVWPR